MRNIRSQSCLFIFLMVFVYSSFLMAGTPQSKQKKAVGGIYQLVETRSGKRSCWEIIIRLNDLTFNKSIDNDELTITDGKYQRDMKPIMTWAVDEHGKKLTIQFKVGMGDFGTGDHVTVGIRGYAFVSNPEQDYVFQISTDIL